MRGIDGPVEPGQPYDRRHAPPPSRVRWLSQDASASVLLRTHSSKSSSALCHQALRVKHPSADAHARSRPAPSLFCLHAERLSAAFDGAPSFDSRDSRGKSCVFKVRGIHVCEEGVLGVDLGLSVPRGGEVGSTARGAEVGETK